MILGIPVTTQNNHNIGPHLVSMETLFPIVERTLRDNRKIFSKCCPIPQAKMPIIKFLHAPTKVFCDLSFKNNMAGYNSQLMKFYISMDPRFRPLMMIIKYWIHSCELRSTMGITKYALAILFIFYLQQIGLVPSVDSLKKRCSAPLTINGWQVNFDDTTLNFEMKSKYKDQSIPDLLKGFYEFYANYDFKTTVVCISDGHSHNKESFNDIEHLPASMWRYNQYVEDSEDTSLLSTWKPICVQDPNELNRNVAETLHDKHVEKFQTFCSIAANRATSSSKHDYKDLLGNLFHVANNSSKATNGNFSSTKDTHFIFSICPNYSFEKNINPRNGKRFLLNKNKWYGMTFDIIKQYLEEVLNFQVKVSNVDRNSYQYKSNINSLGFQRQYVTELHCKGTHCLWENRKSIKIIDQHMTPLQREIEISKIILMNINVKNDSSANSIIDFKCHLLEMMEPDIHIKLSFINNGCSGKIFLNIINFLPSRLQTTINKTFNFIFNS